MEKIKCKHCGYEWTPKNPHPTRCANKDCNRKIVYDITPITLNGINLNDKYIPLIISIIQLMEKTKQKITQEKIGEIIGRTQGFVSKKMDTIERIEVSGIETLYWEYIDNKKRLIPKKRRDKIIIRKIQKDAFNRFRDKAIGHREDIIHTFPEKERLILKEYIRSLIYAQLNRVEQNYSEYDIFTSLPELFDRISNNIVITNTIASGVFASINKKDLDIDFFRALSFLGVYLRNYKGYNLYDYGLDIESVKVLIERKKQSVSL